jgi:hypothetical protein
LQATGIYPAAVHFIQKESALERTQAKTYDELAFIKGFHRLKGQEEYNVRLLDKFT